MASRTTRGAAARETALIALSLKEIEPQQLSSPPHTPDSKAPRKIAIPRTVNKRTPKAKKDVDAISKIALPTAKSAGVERKRAALNFDNDVNALPHNLGTVALPIEYGEEVGQVQENAPAKTATKRKLKAKEGVDAIQETVVPNPKAAGTKRKRSTAKSDGDINALPHNLGTVALPSKPQDEGAREEAQDETPAKKRRVRNAAAKEEAVILQEIAADEVRDPPQSGAKRKPRKASGKSPVDPDVNASVDIPGNEALLLVKKRRSRKSAAEELIVGKSAAVKTAEQEKPKKRAKKTTYGVTPFPEHPHPTPEECHQVNDLLAAEHGVVKPPDVIPAPSLELSGCGEVPSVLDALIRTLLSAATAGGNSAKAFQGLVKMFGLVNEGIGKGSVDWNKVRQADVSEIEKAIHPGGMAPKKSAFIKKILGMVYEEGQVRREGLLVAEKNGVEGPAGAESEAKEEKDAEIARVDQDVLSLQHLHAFSDHDAMDEMIKYPGIGRKTASCVLLFCLKRASFAVDTHVFRICRWLNWIPQKATRDSAWAHCEVKVPDHLKYPLHQLMIMHGKKCPRCRAITGEGSEGWEDGCPIDQLVTRTGKRKEKGASAAQQEKKAKKVAAREDDEEQADLDDDEGLSEVDVEIEDIEDIQL